MAWQPTSPVFTTSNPSVSDIHKAITDRVENALLNLMPWRGGAGDPQQFISTVQHIVMVELDTIRQQIPVTSMHYHVESELDALAAVAQVVAVVTICAEPAVAFDWKLDFGQSPFTDKRIKGFETEDGWDCWPLEGTNG